MEGYNRYILTLLVLLASSSLAFGQVDTLTVIHVNDSHSNLLPFSGGRYGGIARVATKIGQWRMTEPNAIMVHTGDFMVGTLMFNTFFGVPELKILDAIGFDAIVLGNHEFDVGPEQLGGILATAELSPNLAVLAANLENLDQAPLLQSIVRPYVIKERGGLKIGLIGITTPAANVESRPAPVVVSMDLIESTMAAVAELKAAGTDVILLLSHLGLDLDTQIAGSGYLQGVDAIIGGHSHTPMVSPLVVEGIPIIQAGPFYSQVGKLRLVINNGVVSVLDSALEEITRSIPEEPTTAAMLAQLQGGIMQQYWPVMGNAYGVIGFASGYLNASPDLNDLTLDTPLGNHYTRALFESGLVPDIDMALEPTGHIVADIPFGSFTASELFRTFPYGYRETDGLGFRVATYQLYGAEVQAVLENLMPMVKPGSQQWDYLIQATGLRYTVLNDSDHLTLDKATVGGADLETYRLYTVVSSDQVVGYLQGLFGITPANLVIHPVSVYEVMRSYVVKEQRLDPLILGNITVTGSVSTEEQGEIIKHYELDQNYPNPFNPQTTISYRLTQSGDVQLGVYNVLGQLVSTLQDGVQPVGEYTRTFDAADLTSGVYFYTLTVSGYSKTRSMVLLR